MIFFAVVAYMLFIGVILAFGAGIISVFFILAFVICLMFGLFLLLLL